MKTTRKQALKIINIVKWVNPYEVCELDKEEYLQEIMNIELADNIKELDAYICENCEAQDLLRDTTLLRKYLNLVKELN